MRTAAAGAHSGVQARGQLNGVWQMVVVAQGARRRRMGRCSKALRISASMHWKTRFRRGVVVST